MHLLAPALHAVAPSARRRHYGHDGGIVWLTGLSGAGKTTLAMRLERVLSERGYSCFALDGDNLRGGLNADLGFSAQDRSENVRRIGEVAGLFAEAGLICIAACISPFRADRERLRHRHGRAFHEIHLAAELAHCEARDPKGLYRKARAGELAGFTGIASPYETPEHPDLVLHTGRETVEQSLARLLAYVVAALPMTSSSGELPAARPA